MFRCILGKPPQFSWQEKLYFSRGSLSSVAVDRWYISERNIVKLCTYCWTSNFKFKAFELTPVKKLLIWKVLIIPVEKFKSRHIWAEPTQGWTMFSFNHDPSHTKVLSVSLWIKIRGYQDPLPRRVVKDQIFFQQNQVNYSQSTHFKSQTVQVVNAW